MSRRPSRLRWLAGGYLVLLVASHGVRRLETPASDAAAGAAGLSIVEAASPAAARPVAVAYRWWGDERSAATPVLLLHGSPGSHRDFATLAPELARTRRALAPDLPGFGASQRDLPDYSIAAHARWVEALLDRLGVARAHVLGFSMGGGVALELADRAPERVRSVVLLSSIGVQELELLGSYHLNHALHAAQLGLLWAVHEATPHFGLLDGFPLDIPYARNFYDTDQRPLRGHLRRLAAPTLIVHGTRDVLVPVAAAREHHRLVPQSDLVLYEGDHFRIFGGGASLAPPIADFLARVDRGGAATRPEAPAERRERAAEPFDPRSVPRAGGLALLALMLLLATATFVSEDLACIATGLLVARGRIGLLPGATACFLGILLGDLAIFWAGRLFGRPFLSRAPLRWLISPDKVRRSSHWFSRRGPAVILLSRFLPGTRVATYFAAGLLHTRFSRFFAWFVLAVAVWTPSLVWLSSLLGSRLLAWFESLGRGAFAGLALLALTLWLLVELAVLLATARGRRLLVGWWRRKTRWEFWPPWAFYPPVVAWVLLLAARHRSATVFTAANPAIPAGGFLGESKAAILDLLPRDAVATYRLVPGSRLAAAARRRAVEAFLADAGLAPPIVLKPDAGQRGAGVVVARSSAEIDDYCERAGFDFLAQEYVAGPELGVFWARRPGEPHGRIISVTEKVLPAVVGDGESTVEELVLGDPRAVALAELYLDRLEDQVDRVPAAGERVPLAELGTHCLGAIFLDGDRHRTPPVEAAFEALGDAADGFWFGRYDVRSPSIEAFHAGRFRILELNGVTSEATHIYDPKHSLFDAYRILFRQWSLAFEIGRRNRARGARVTPLRELIAELWRFRRRRRAVE